MQRSGPMRAACSVALAVALTAPCAAQQAETTAASPLLGQAMPSSDPTRPDAIQPDAGQVDAGRVDAGRVDEDSRWPTEARVAAPGGDEAAHDPRVPAMASVSIGEAAARAADGDSAPAPTLDPRAGPPRTEAAVPPTPPSRDVVAQSGSSVDSATLRRMADKLIAMGLLAQGDDINDPAVLAEALRAFQAAAGIAPTGTLDRDTIGRLLS